MSSRVSVLAVLVVIGLATGACTGSVEFSFGGQTPADAAVELIESEAMGQRLGVEKITGAMCQDPPDTEVGTTFPCTAESAGQKVEFEVVFEEEGRIFAGPTNIVDSVALIRLETTAVKELNRANDFTLPEDSMECGDSAVILDSNMQMICALTDPSNGVVFDAQVTVTNTDTGDFSVIILGEAE